MLKDSSEGKEKANMRIIETSNTGNDNTPVGPLPLIRLYYPTEYKNHEVLWQGPLTMENVNRIINSPARREIVRRIQKGDAITWIFLPGENKDRNEVASKNLDVSLNKLSAELRLSTSATDASGEPLDINTLNQGVHFSMLTISRDDPEEEIFIRMLLGIEADLPFVKSPLAFPVFGRGRVLYALVGKGIKYKMIETTCNSMIGWCSCTVKEDNPGSDLLFSADWNKAIGDSSWIQEQELPEITGISAFAPTETEEQKDSLSDTTETIPTAEGEAPTPEIIGERENNTLGKEEIKKIEADGMASEKEHEVTPATFSDPTKSRISPLVRNSLLMVVSLLIMMLMVLIFLRKRNSNS
ncbi:MAG: hypothetical protein JEZ14_16125 [Marinilabiliaceae bacterium]|nr:hypothetical protein [Marinilabiliaceae bacterium]